MFGAHLVMERETVGEQSARRERWGIGQLGQAQAKESGTGGDAIARYLVTEHPKQTRNNVILSIYTLISSRSKLDEPNTT